MNPLVIVVQNQSDSIHAEGSKCSATARPTVVFPAPGGPVRISSNGSFTTEHGSP